ncbi:hypothetical protein [Actinomadura harenae]|uniref:Uncharacterized protein n=1 Tax=Actinomadura harenae TaxID=2483351 RepID=A0A3M2M9N4_9ACTN|nr:hypothetical protein EBO15_08180 [Actinomadura harenae]
MGGKHADPYGLYRGDGPISAPLAAKTGVTSDDLAILRRSMQLMFEPVARPDAPRWRCAACTSSPTTTFSASSPPRCCST